MHTDRAATDESTSARGSEDFADGVTSTSKSRSNLMIGGLLFVGILNYLDRQLPYILGNSIKADLGLSDVQLGMLGGVAFAVCYSLAALPIAWIADRWSPKKTLLICMAVWSAMTCAASRAGTFGVLALTRVGVALGEAGATPSAHALVSSAIPPSRRGTAIAIFSLALPLGSLLGLAGGGWLNDHANWRVSLLLAGLVGMLCTPLLGLVLTDSEPVKTKMTVPLKEAIVELFSSRAYVYLFIDISLAALAFYPMVVFTAPFLMRSHGLTTTQVGVALALIQGIPGIIGMIAGGRIFDAYAQRSPGRLMSWPGMSYIVAAPCFLLALFAKSNGLALLMLVPFTFAMAVYMPVIFSGAQRLASPYFRALASSFLLIGSGVIGGTLGPLLVGKTSDLLVARFGPDSLRWALLEVPVASLLTGIAMLATNRALVGAYRNRAPAPVPAWHADTLRSSSGPLSS